MKLESQVCSLELAKKLKELGVKQESEFSWVDKFPIVTDIPIIIPTYTVDSYLHKRTEDFVRALKSNVYSAFTVAELGEILPFGIFTMKGFHSGWYVNIHTNYPKKNYLPVHEITMDDCNVESMIISSIRGKTEADARAKMLIKLIENNLLNNPILLSGEKE